MFIDDFSAKYNFFKTFKRKIVEILTFLNVFGKKKVSDQLVIWFTGSFIITVAAESQACQVCYGSADPINLLPLNLAILSMLFFILSVLGTFAWFFIQFWRRARRFAN